MKLLETADKQAAIDAARGFLQIQGEKKDNAK